MAEKRIVCVGTGSRLTNPASISAENGRFYRYPDPGTVHRWEGDGTTYEVSSLEKHELTAAYPGGPVIQGYGLIVLGDTYMQLLKTPVESEAFIPRRTRAGDFETKIDSAMNRARAIAEDWRTYGALIIAGQSPSSEELELARAQRRDYALNRLNQAINLQKGGKKALYSEAEKAWAFEYGFVLPTAVEAMQKVKTEVVEATPCPECQMPIHELARRCRHCGFNFKMALIEYLTAPAASIEPGDEPRRGPGRPRKELVEV